jgi:dihydrofolate reductase
MTISLIAAVAQNRAIGKNNQLLWHLPEDMRYFREATRSKTVIMGRKTWESLPEKFRPLPGRRNIVVTHDRRYVAGGAVLAHSLEEAIDVAGNDGETFVIGGAELYRQALPMAQRLYLTEVAQAYDGDVFFPEHPVAEWLEVSREEQCSESGIEFAFVVYQRR